MHWKIVILLGLLTIFVAPSKHERLRRRTLSLGCGCGGSKGPEDGLTELDANEKRLKRYSEALSPEHERYSRDTSSLGCGCGGNSDTEDGIFGLSMDEKRIKRQSDTNAGPTRIRPSRPIRRRPRPTRNSTQTNENEEIVQQPGRYVPRRRGFARWRSNIVSTTSASR